MRATSNHSILHFSTIWAQKVNKSRQKLYKKQQQQQLQIIDKYLWYPQPLSGELISNAWLLQASASNSATTARPLRKQAIKILCAKFAKTPPKKKSKIRKIRTPTKHKNKRILLPPFFPLEFHIILTARKTKVQAASAGVGQQALTKQPAALPRHASFPPLGKYLRFY